MLMFLRSWFYGGFYLDDVFERFCRSDASVRGGDEYRDEVH